MTAPNSREALTRDEERLVTMYRAGGSIIIGCQFGFMVRVDAAPDGRTLIGCPKDPGPIVGPAEAAFVAEAISAWCQRLREYEDANGTVVQ